MKNLGSEAGGVSRRDALKAFGAAGAAGAMLSASHLFGQQVNKSTAKGGRIDVHHHHAPPALETGPGRAGRAPWTPEHAEYIPNGTYTELKKFYFDVAHASFPMPLAALLKFASGRSYFVRDQFLARTGRIYRERTCDVGAAAEVDGGDNAY